MKEYKLVDLDEDTYFNPPKLMGVADEIDHSTTRILEREVIAYRGGKWYAFALDIDKVERWEYAYSIIDKDSTLVTNRELSKWLAEGKGQIHCVGTRYIQTYYSYLYGKDDLEVPDYYEVRKTTDTEWHRPTREYLELDDK